MEEVKLFGHWLSPFSCRVENALELKGVKYEFVEEDPSNKSALLLQYNYVNKKIPVLLHNGKPIIESILILEYIDETWKANCSIMPEDPHEKAIVRFWAKFVDEKCLPALSKTIWSTGEQYERDKGEAAELLKVFEEQLRGKKFFGGDSVGMVDIVANFIAFWYRAIQEALGLDVFTQDKFPNLWQWAEDFVSCSVVKKNLPPQNELIADFPPPYLGEALVGLFRSRLLSHTQAQPPARS